MRAIDPRRVQAALVCMHLDPDYAAAVRGAGPLPELAEAERGLLRAVDPRALAADRYRRARAVHVLIEEYPATAALIGVAAVDSFFSSAAFRTCVFEHGSMALSFGTWLGDRAAGPGRIEAAIATARRPVPPGRAPGLAPAGGLARAPGLVPVFVPEGSLACLERIRARLGPDPVAALAERVRPGERPPRSHRVEAVLVEARPDGDVSLGTASMALARLLQFAGPGRSRDEVAVEAVRLGAEDDEVDALLAGLLADGSLVAI